MEDFSSIALKLSNAALFVTAIAEAVQTRKWAYVRVEQRGFREESYEMYEMYEAILSWLSSKLMEVQSQLEVWTVCYAEFLAPVSSSSVSSVREQQLHFEA